MLQDNPLLEEKLNQSDANVAAFEGYEAYYDQSPGPHAVKLENFPKYVTRESITRLLSLNDLFLKQLHVCGSIIELGVFRGAGLMTWAHLSSIYEPTNYTRKIIGFDTFNGFPEVAAEDIAAGPANSTIRPGGLAVEADMKEDIERAVELWGLTRYLNHIPKVDLVAGDIMEMLPRYLEENPHLVVSLLHLDVDLYEPTKLALQLLAPRIPKGGLIFFDELNMKIFPGETIAVAEAAGLNNLRIQRLSYSPAVSFAVIE